MILRFGHLCDYATVDAGNKFVMVGVFDTIESDQPSAVFFKPCWLAATVDAHAGEGEQHRLELRLLDGDGRQLVVSMLENFKVMSRTPARPLMAQLLVLVGGLNLAYGDYCYEIRHMTEKDGVQSFERIGEIPFFVTRRETAPLEPWQQPAAS